MKKIGLYMLVILFSLPALAQKKENFFEQLTGKYADREGFSASMITKDMFDLYLKKKNIENESSVYGAIKNLDNIMIISQSNINTVGNVGANGNVGVKTAKQEEIRNELLETILNYYKTGDYSLFKTEKRMGEDVKVYIKKNQEKVTSLALITSSSASTNLIELQGDINLAAVAELGSAFNLRGLDNLSKINNSGNSIYIGPYIYSSNGNLEEMAARQREIAERQRILSEEQVAKAKEQYQLAIKESTKDVEKVREMYEKARELAERYRRQPIFLNYPGDSTIYYLNGKKVDADEIKKLDQGSIKTIDISGPEKDNNKTTIRIKTK